MLMSPIPVCEIVTYSLCWSIDDASPYTIIMIDEKLLDEILTFIFTRSRCVNGRDALGTGYIYNEMSRHRQGFVVVGYVDLFNFVNIM